MAGPVSRRVEVVEGRRVETVEWGLRATRDHGAGELFTRKGHVEQRGSEANCRQIIAAIQRGESVGWGPVEVVKRTVVTYTAGWEAAPVSTEPEPVDMIAVLQGRAELPWKKTSLQAPGTGEGPQGSLF